ncbi:Rieske (2Fe-2S) protein [Planosporangium thailandense]|uniref:Rieske (2Fe-2S) protein n=1 Tax=Planosporangium thailandense TaxID=765197 RepID=A0ABX0Y7R8_9ACTN|nr:Rieske (2Fe-2S) protein [Planosporangium thailandense]NJC73324.1 Rieske (2Fe-2S) protein [Planosporangium thailandense]
MGRLVATLERLTIVDGIADQARKLVRGATRSQRVRDLLHGVWLGHPLHPAVVLAPIGAWLSAAILDAMPGQQAAATTLVAAGTATAVPAAATGANDWASLSREQRRVGFVHAAANTVALGLYGASLTARLRGRHTTGRRLAYVGLAVAGTGAYIGGHLSYALGAGVNQAVPALWLLRGTWQRLGDVDDFVDGEPTVRKLGETPVLVYRQADRFTVMLERCAHHNGPLGDGKIVEIDGAPCVVCPWHGSTYRLTDGVVVHGPAANDQITLRTRIVDGRLEAAPA